MSEDNKYDELMRELTTRPLQMEVADKVRLLVEVAANDLAAWKAIYKLCIELRNFEISQLVQRNNFFMIFQGVLFAGICQSLGLVPVVSFVVCLVGVGVSGLQVCMACGAKYWQAHWEMNSSRAEQAMLNLTAGHTIIRKKIDELGVLGAEATSKLEQRSKLVELFAYDSNREIIKSDLETSRPNAYITNWLIMRKFSSSRIPIYAGIFFLVMWLILLLNTLDVPGGFHVPGWISGFSTSSSS